MKAYIKTYGCQMNEQDSLQMKGLLARMGYAPSLEPEGSDLVLFVTCSIREKAVHKVYSDLGRLRPLTEVNPGMIVGVAGCVAQQEKSALHRRFPFLDLVFGPDAIRELPEMISRVTRERDPSTGLRAGEGRKTKITNTRFHPRAEFEFVNLIVDGEENRVRAFVNIQKGCDNVCAFCIVPRVRGGEVSRPAEEIIGEISSLTDLGVKEITLLGQNVNSYGLKNGELPFAGLLERIAKETSVERLRFTSSHPKDVGVDLVEKFCDLEILCPHFHLPVQSGSDRVLKAMRRGYTRAEYVKKIEALRKARPDIAFSSDFIVGFPGEEEEDFAKTLSLMDEVGFDASFSFAYSPRPGTTALRLHDGLSEAEKKTRLSVLQERQKEISGRINRALEGTVQEVLVENGDEIGQNWFGRTGTNKLVRFGAARHGMIQCGQKVPVKILQGNPKLLVGEVAGDAR